MLSEKAIKEIEKIILGELKDRFVRSLTIEFEASNKGTTLEIYGNETFFIKEERGATVKK